MIAILIMLGFGLAFLYAYARELGEPIWHLWHHLAVLMPLLILGYASVGWVGRLSSRFARLALAGLICCAVVCLQLGFYAACLFTLYGFHDLPTRTIVLGYWDQMGIIVAALPITRGLLIATMAVVFALFLALAAVFAWLMLRSTTAYDLQSQGRSRVSWPRMALVSAFVLAFFLCDPWAGLSGNREPLVSSLYDHPLVSNRQTAQAYPAEMATDLNLAAAYPQSPLGTRAHVVLIYIDALRADVLQPYGGEGEMPFVTKLVRTGQLQQFNSVFSSCSMTTCGIASILQSRPANHVAAGKFSLPMVLKRQGYDLRYLLSSDHEHFVGLKEYYGPNIDYYLDGKGMDPSRSTDDFVMLEHLSGLPITDAIKAPQFIMLGLMSVHVQGIRHDQFRSHMPDKVSWDSGIRGDIALPYRNSYLNGVRQTDYVLEKIWHWLDDAGYLRQSIVVITADHGESLGEKHMIGHARDLSTPQIHIPLWMHVPKAAWIQQPFAFQTDIAPTILDWLHLPIPASWVGQSLLSPRDRHKSLPLFFLNGSDKFGLIFEDGPFLYKYLYEQAADHASLFDLYSDTADSRNLLGTLTVKRSAALKAKLTSEFRLFLRH